MDLFVENITTYENELNQTANSTEKEDPVFHPVATVIILLHYAIIFILGLIGNCLVCYVVFRHKHMRTVTNFFIANLALADILLCVLAVPFTPLYFFMGKWVFGSILCSLLAVAQGTSVYVSTLTLTSIAIDRYFVIMYPFRPKLPLKLCFAIILGVWLLSISAIQPYMFYVSHIKFGNVFYCEELWPTEEWRKVFSLFTTTLQFAIPFVVILFCYVKISLRMNERIRARPGCRSSRKEEIDREKKRRTNRMLIGMVTIFGGCWMPVNLIHLTSDYYMEVIRWKYFNLCFFIAHIIAMSSTCYNPFLYAWLNENFRREFQQVLPCFSAADYPSRSQTRYRSERTCNGNETVDDVLPNHALQESYANAVDSITEEYHSSVFNHRPSQSKVTAELIQLSTLEEEVSSSNGEIKDTNGDLPSLLERPLRPYSNTFV